MEENVLYYREFSWWIAKIKEMNTAPNLAAYSDVYSLCVNKYSKDYRLAVACCTAVS